MGGLSITMTSHAATPILSNFYLASWSTTATPVAQSLEQRPFNPWVGGSSPSGPTISVPAPASSQVLTVVNFDSAKAVIKTADAAKLRAFAAVVKSAGYTTLTVYGHTDSVGGVDNKKLSVARANAAITCLKKLLPGVTFEVSGFAASKQVADNATAEGKASNRRAEISIP